MNHVQPNTLTTRQMEIVELAVWCHSTKSVGVILGISAKTVVNTITTACEKLRLGSAQELTAWYLENVKGLERPKKVEFSQTVIAGRIRGLGSLILLAVIFGAQFDNDFAPQRAQRAPQRSYRTARSGRGSRRDDTVEFPTLEC